MRLNSRAFGQWNLFILNPLLIKQQAYTKESGNHIGFVVSVESSLHLQKNKKGPREISSPEGVKLCVCRVWLCSGNIPSVQVISDDFTLLVTSASNLLKVNSCVIVSKYLLSQFQAIPIDIWTELVFPRPQSCLCTTFVLTISYYYVNIMSLTGIALFIDEMCILQAKTQKLTSSLLAPYPRNKIKRLEGCLKYILFDNFLISFSTLFIWPEGWQYIIVFRSLYPLTLENIQFCMEQVKSKTLK